MLARLPVCRHHGSPFQQSPALHRPPNWVRAGPPMGGGSPPPRARPKLPPTGMATGFGGFFATTNREHQGVPPISSPPRRVCRVFSPPALGQMLPTLHTAVICRRNRGTGRCGRRKAAHPAAPSRGQGLGLLPPWSPSRAQRSELQAKSSSLLPAPAPSTTLAPGAALHQQYRSSHPNTRYRPLRAPGCIPEPTPSAADNHAGQR